MRRLFAHLIACLLLTAMIAALAPAAAMDEAHTDAGYITGTVSELFTPVQGVMVKVNETGGTATTDADGKFNLSVPAGTYNLTASKIDYRDAYRSNVKVTDGNETSVSIFIERLEGNADVTVKDKKAGTPLKNAMLSVDEFTFIPCQPLGCISGPDGRLQVTSLPVGTWTFNASAGGYLTATKKVLITADATIQLTMELDPDPSAGKARVKGTVKDASNSKTIAGAKVGFLQGTAEKASAMTDANGWFSGVLLEPGDYTVKVTAAGYRILEQTKNFAKDTEVNLTITLITDAGGGDGSGGGGSGGGLLGMGTMADTALFAIIILVAVIAVVAVMMSRKKRKAAAQQQRPGPPGQNW
jgi:uncharacterized surface anchored protein